MTTGDAVSVRPLTAEDRGALASFSCRGGGPWTELVEEMVRGRLADELALADDLEAHGLWLGDKLAAVVAWRHDPETRLLRSIVLAVDRRHQRRGYGRQLKLLEIDHARQVRARAIVSTVHWDNDPMINLNWSLGGTFSPQEGDPMHLTCVIAL